MKQAPDWLRIMLFNLHLRRLDRFCERVGRHVCIYPAGHMTQKEAEEVFRRIREWRLDKE